MKTPSAQELIREATINGPPPGGWKDSDRVPDKYRKGGNVSPAKPAPSELYTKACTTALDSLAIIAQLASDPDVKACAEMSGEDLAYFLKKKS